MSFGSKKRLFGDNKTKVQNATLFTSLLSNVEVKDSLQASKLNKVIIQITNNILQKIKEEVRTKDILAACKSFRIFQHVYEQIFKTFKWCISRVDKGLNLKQLSNFYLIKASHK